MIYYKTIPALTDVNTTNWLLTAYPHVYLYASLIQAAPFLGNADRLGMWSQMLDLALNAIATADLRSKYAMMVSRPRSPTP
jgi:hypothetical protein